MLLVYAVYVSSYSLYVRQRQHHDSCLALWYTLYNICVRMLLSYVDDMCVLILSTSAAAPRQLPGSARAQTPGSFLGALEPLGPTYIGLVGSVEVEVAAYRFS